MTSETRRALLGVIVEQQSSTAPVTLQIGGMHGTQVENDCIRLLEAPESVLRALLSVVSTLRADAEYVQIFIENGAVIIR